MMKRHSAHCGFAASAVGPPHVASITSRQKVALKAPKMQGAGEAKMNQHDETGTGAA
jgi:hypothetical protein